MTKRFIFLFAITALALAASGSAFAADMAVKAPPSAPAPVDSWTGWYVGGNVGDEYANNLWTPIRAISRRHRWGI
jgi:outer membrane immunogenic protein